MNTTVSFQIVLATKGTRTVCALIGFKLRVASEVRFEVVAPVLGKGLGTVRVWTFSHAIGLD